MDDYEFKWDVYRENCPWNETNCCKALSASDSGECCEKNCAPFFWLKKFDEHFVKVIGEAQEQAEAEIEALKKY